ncbi:arylamine N-acetyltransferase-like isoform X2 [Haemaphysalis longicornis]
MEPLSEQQTEVYLKHLGLPKPTEASREYLDALIRAHLERVPFENLDVLLSRPISLEAEDLLSKVTQRGRGGYCLELNSLFARLLLALGYRVHLRAARRPFPTPDDSHRVSRLSHVVIYVEFDHDSDCLVDVGMWLAGLHRALSVSGETDPFRIRVLHPSKALEVSAPTSGGGWKIFYTVESHVFEWVDVAPLNWYTSTHPDSSMRRFLFVGRRGVKDGHWLRIMNNRYIRWSPKDGIVEKRIFQGEDEILDALQNEFGVNLDPEKDVLSLRIEIRQRLESLNSGANALSSNYIWPEG